VVDALEEFADVDGLVVPVEDVGLDVVVGHLGQ
jgi:hypothetical protein